MNITKIHEINGYIVTCLFNNGESRRIDFAELFKRWQITAKHIAFPLLANQAEFAKVKVIDGSFEKI
jgi:hypothetical protein